MKRLIGMILVVLILCGCTAPHQNVKETFPGEEGHNYNPAEPVGIYEPFSDMEIQTGGAVRSYLPNIPNCYGMMTIGGDVLLFSGTEKTILTRLSGDNLFIIARAELGCFIDPKDTSFQISPNGITYFNYDSREIIFLDHDLKEVSKLAMPAEMIGKPVLSSNRMMVYYCTGDAIRGYDMQSKLDKLIKSISYPDQSMEDVLVHDTVLRCSLKDGQGLTYSIFLSAETGEMLSMMQYGLQLTAGGDMYYAVLPEGILNVMLFGDGEGEERVLTPADPFADPWFLEVQHGAITVSTGSQSSVLDYYDLNTGLRTASVELPGSIDPWYIEADADSTKVYLMGCDTNTQQTVLCCWQLDKSAVQDEKVYTGPRYTLENPDIQGLEECRSFADALYQTYGVQILFGAEGIDAKPWDYTLEPEYQVPVIRVQLQKLERLLQNFPEDFFKNIYGGKRISIVRRIEGNAQSGSVEAASGVQFWWGNTACVALAAGDTLERSFFHEIFHVIDNKVLSDCSVYYYWEWLNPTEFQYFEDYTSYLTEDVSDYLQEENRAFIDAYSTCFPKEDRARIMEYACTEGNAHYFQSEIMQSKLRTLCEGIRTAFRMKDYPHPLLWEQYLNEPMVS